MVAARESAAERRRRARRLLARLRAAYPDADCELGHRDPFQLLVATILSAQTTDRAVNKVTPALFRRFPTPRRLASARPEEIEPLIASIGLFRTKARAVVGTARALVERFGGKVPRDRKALESLPGVGRKTANVVLSTAFGEPALAVDTHVQRLARRLGLSRAREPRKIEEDLTALFPAESWGFASHALIWHGRRVCSARAPRCGSCVLADDCPSAGAAAEGRARPVRARSGGRRS
ncbi:MAG: endonuclease III [Acidobacteria bacterium]|nr:MAG: endonuclease III [Acidobacteriota bacterium]